MKMNLSLVRVIAITLPALAFASAASAAVETANELCSNIAWNAAFLKDYPKAPAACRDVTVKDGVKYAKFNGKVSKVSDTYVQVEISDVGNFPISTIAFQVGVGGQVTMNDKVEKVKDLKVGDQLTFWVPEGQFGISPTLADRPIAIIKPEGMKQN
jgi:hypothetical protein